MMIYTSLFVYTRLWDDSYKTRRPPRVCCSVGSVGGHIACKYSTFFAFTMVCIFCISCGIIIARFRKINHLCFKFYRGYFNRGKI